MVTLLEWSYIHILGKFCQEDICLFEWVWHVQGLFPAKQRIDKPRELCIICLVLYLKKVFDFDILMEVYSISDGKGNKANSL